MNERSSTTAGGVISWARRSYDLVGRTEAVVAAVLLILMVLLIFGGGVARMLRHPLNWTTDFATCFFAWAAFLSADVAWRNDALMNVDLVSGRLGVAAQRTLTFVSYAIIAVFLIYVVGAGIWLAIVSSGRSFQGIPWISYSWVTASLPAGALLLLVTTALKAYRLALDPNAAGPGTLA